MGKIGGKRMEKYLREFVNGLIYLVGVVLLLFVLVVMIFKVYERGSFIIIFLLVIFFGVSMILLYSVFVIYYLVIVNDKVIKVLKRLDYLMIFILIVGLYVLFCLVVLDGKIGMNLFLVVIICVVIGIMFKICWIICLRWVSSVMYIGIGWFVIFVIYLML